MDPPVAPSGAATSLASSLGSPGDGAADVAAMLAAAGHTSEPPVIDPDLPGWIVIQRTTQTGRSYKVYHGPRGEYAESRRQALLLASGEALMPTQLAPKSKKATLPVIEGSPGPSKAALQVWHISPSSRRINTPSFSFRPKKKKFGMETRPF